MQVRAGANAGGPCDCHLERRWLGGPRLAPQEKLPSVGRSKTRNKGGWTWGSAERAVVWELQKENPS